jgi:hypothetical protein
MTTLTAAMNTFKAKYSNLKRIELATFIRSPMNKPCPGSMPFKSFIRPEQDEAYDKMAAMYPDLIRVAPKFEVRSCGDFGGGPPHLGGSAGAMATMMGNYYK